MKYLLFLLVLTSGTQSIAQNVPGQAVKTYSVGLAMRITNIRPVNEALHAAGYETIPDGVLMASMGQSFLDPKADVHAGFFYTLEAGVNRLEKGARSTRFCVHGGNVGVVGQADFGTKVKFSGRLALNYSAFAVRLYDADADTSSLQAYLQQPTPDMKYFSGYTFSCYTGVDVALPLQEEWYFSVGGGHILPFGPARMNTDAGVFKQYPRFFPARWEVHLLLTLALFPSGWQPAGC